MSRRRTTKHIIIAGGASGLGREMVLQAVKNGYRVAFFDINDNRGKQLSAELTDDNVDHIYIRCDIRLEEQCRRAVEKVIQRWGRVDIAVQAAGVASAGLVESVTLEHWRKQLDVNLLGTVNFNQAVLRPMKQQGSGYMVNVAGLIGLMPTPSMSSFAATNAAVIAYTESLYTELEPLNIQVSVICPNFFKSQLNENLYTADPIAKARFERLLNRPDMPTEEVARRAFAQMDKQRFMILPSPNTGVLWRQKRWFPDRFYRSLLALAKKVRPAP